VLRTVKKIFKYLDDQLSFCLLVIKLANDTVWFSVPDFVKSAKIDNFENNYNKMVKLNHTVFPFIDEGGERFTDLSCLQAMIEFSKLSFRKKFYFLKWAKDLQDDIKSDGQLKYVRVVKKIKETRDKLQKDNHWLEQQRKNLQKENIRLREIADNYCSKAQEYKKQLDLYKKQSVMRDATEEERQSVKNYIESISEKL